MIAAATVRIAGTARALLLLAPLAVLPAGASERGAGPGADDVTGIWATEPRDSGAYITVRIAPCRGAPAERCGTVVGAHAGARPDIVGEPIISGMQPQGDGGWSGGEIIRPGDGDRYSSKLRLVGEGLEVKGCVAAGLICQAQIWTRVR